MDQVQIEGHKKRIDVQTEIQKGKLMGKIWAWQVILQQSQTDEQELLSQSIEELEKILHQLISSLEN